MADGTGDIAGDAPRVYATLRMSRALRDGDAVATVAAARNLIAAGGDLVDVYEIATAVVHGLAGRAGDHAAFGEERSVEALHALVEGVHIDATRRRDADVVLAAAPGELHTLGITMVASLLRHHGYGVTLVDGDLRDGISELVPRLRQLVAVGVSIHAVDDPDELMRDLRDIRDDIGDAAILLGGYSFARSDQLSRLGADAVVSGLRDALVVLRRLTSPLSDRETEVLQAIADGMETEEVASHLGVQQSTVREHVQRSFVKLAARTRAAAVAEALRRGLID